MTLADRIAVLDGGIVKQFGAPMDLYRYPDNLFVAGFIGSPKMNFLPVQVLSSDLTQITIEADGLNEFSIAANGESLKVGAQLTLGIRPEHIVIAREGSVRHQGKVVLVERLGHQTFIEITTDHNQSVTALIDADHDIALGDRIGLHYDASKCHLFDAAGQALRGS